MDEPSHAWKFGSVTVDAALTESPVRIVGRVGIDDFDLSTGAVPVPSLFRGTLYEDVVGEVCAGSTVNDLRMVIGFGEMTGGGVGESGPVCCQRSSTALCLLPGVDARSGAGDPSGVYSSAALFSTIFLTNPRPFSLLRLGVGSFDGGGFRNAGDGLWDGGICGDPNEVRGAGWMGRARPGRGTMGLGE